MAGLFYPLIIANLFHGLAGVLWISGVRRVARPLAPDLEAELLRLGLVIPAVLTIAKGFGLPFFPQRSALIRVDDWALALSRAGWAVKGPLFLLLGGLFAVFVLQELIPMIGMLRSRNVAPSAPDAKKDERLLEILNRVNKFWSQAEMPRARRTRAAIIQSAVRIRFNAPLAALHGLSAPRLVVSDALLDRLSDEELEGVMAHEAAHLYFGGNLRIFFAWGARALQSFNPFSLILFRELVEVRELACDSLAAKLTGRPSVLARALEKFDEPAGGGGVRQGIREAQRELRRRAEADSTRIRLEALSQEGTNRNLTATGTLLLYSMTMGGLLWLIG